MKQRRFSFIESGLRVKVKDLFNTFEFDVTFENIGNNLIESKRRDRRWLIPAVCLLFISVVLLIDRMSGGDVETGAEVFYLCPSIVCFAGYILTYQKSYYITKPNNTSGVEFMIDKPSHNELTDFLAEVNLRRNKYLLTKYGQLIKNLSYESQYNNIVWLHENEVINSREFEMKLKELEILFPPVIKVSGFTIPISDPSGKN